MRLKILYLSLLLLLTTSNFAAQKAITDTGEEVILNDNGTWKYLNKTQVSVKKIASNSKKFKKPSQSTFLLKSVKNDSAYWLNTSKWVFKKNENDPAIEYQFQHKDKDLYAMAITEEIKIGIESLTDIALSNAKDAAPDARVIKKEYRTVNGKKVIYMEMEGTIQSIQFTYAGYYFSDDSGSTQLVTYTSSNLIDKYKPDIVKFLNGLTNQ